MASMGGTFRVQLYDAFFHEALGLVTLGEWYFDPKSTNLFHARLSLGAKDIEDAQDELLERAHLFAPVHMYN